MVSMDSTLFLEQYINKSGFYHLRNISKIRRYLSRRSVETLVHAFVTSKLDFFNSALYRLPGYPIERLQKVQNATARIVTLMPRRSVSRLYIHWLLVEHRIIFKLLLLTYKALNDFTPKYLSDLIDIYVPEQSVQSRQLV